MGHPRIFINAHQASPDALRLAASLGVGGVRIDGNMEDLWPAPDRWTHGWLDDILATCQTLRLEVYLTLSYCPSWLGPNRGDAPPLYDWQTFCTEIARHYAGRLTYIGIWNEYYGSPQDYITRLLKPAADIFHGANAGYQVCGPDLRTEGDWPSWLRVFLQQAGNLMDVLTIHCYAKDGASTWAALTQERRWFELWRKPSIRQVVAQAGWQGPLWLSETGWQSDQVGEAGQAQRWDQLLERFTGSPWLNMLMVFNLMNEEEPDKPAVTWGVFRANGEPKPAAEVLKRYTARVVG